jgi:hypothetical protein
MLLINCREVLDTTSPSWTAKPPYLPLYTLNTSEICLGLSQTSFPVSFRTVTKLLAINTPNFIPYSGQSTLQSYPFDMYVGKMLYISNNS